MDTMNLDRIIHNALILTVNADFDIIRGGMIGIKDGRIACMETTSQDLPAHNGADIMDAGGALVMPGLVNVHTHLPMSLFRGLADDLPLSEWLNHHIFPAESLHIRPENVRIGTRLSCAEMLLSGTTCCCDGYFLETHVAEAVHRMGMRAVLGQGVIDHPAPGVPDPEDNIKTAVEFVKQWKTKDRITPSIFCHSLYTCSAETLRSAKQAAEELGVLFQIHAAETREEAQKCMAVHGLSPVKYLQSLGVLNSRTLVVHAVWVDEEDMDILAAHEAGVAHCPESNMKLGCGVSPVPEMLGRGIPVGLGTDGCASNNNLDLLSEMDCAAKLHKAVAKDPTVMDARTVVEMATIRGAETIGLSERTGSIEIGKEADLIIIDLNRPHLTPLYHPGSHLVYAASGADVRDVLVSGEPLVRNHRLVREDVETIIKEAESAGEAIWKTDLHPSGR